MTGAPLVPSLVEALRQFRRAVGAQSPGLDPHSRSLTGVSLDGILVFWCALALLQRQILFLFIAQLEWRALPMWGIVLGAVLPATVVALVPGRRWRAVAAWLAVTIATLLMTADVCISRGLAMCFPPSRGSRSGR